MQIAALHRRAQIGERAAGAAPAPRRGLEEAGAFLRRAIEIGIGGNADLGRCLHEGFRQRIVMPPVRDRQRTAGAVILTRAALLVFRPLEIRQHVVIAPTGIAVLTPAVVILVLPAHIEQTIDRARTAQHFSAGLKDLAPVQFRLGLGLVHPVDGFFLEQLAVAERHMDPDIGVPGSRFEQQHRVLAVGAQAIGEHATGGTGADDDIIKFQAVIVIVHFVSPRFLFSVVVQTKLQFEKTYGHAPSPEGPDCHAQLAAPPAPRSIAVKRICIDLLAMHAHAVITTSCCNVRPVHNS